MSLESRFDGVFVEPYMDEDMCWISNSMAVRLGRGIAIIERIADDPTTPLAEMRDLAYALGALDPLLANSRRSVSRDCAPWFGEER